MSIVNVLVDRDRAVVAVDTQVLVQVDHEHPPTMGHMSKMLPLVHVNTVLASRGDPRFMLHAFSTLNPICDDAMGVDFIADLLPTLLNAELRVVPPEVLGQSHEVYAVGWSKATGHARGVRCFRPVGGEFTLQEVGESIGPDLGLGSVPPIRWPDQMTKVARRQVALQRDAFPDAAIGGRLLQATITERGMTIENLCDLEQIDG